jgi:hypothetical protein
MVGNFTTENIHAVERITTVTPTTSTTNPPSTTRRFTRARVRSSALGADKGTHTRAADHSAADHRSGQALSKSLALSHAGCFSPLLGFGRSAGPEIVRRDAPLGHNIVATGDSHLKK